MKSIQDHFNILRKISKKTYLNQRVLAQDLGFSLGKLNYCLNELKKRDLLKFKTLEKILIALTHYQKTTIYIF